MESDSEISESSASSWGDEEALVDFLAGGAGGDELVGTFSEVTPQSSGSGLSTSSRALGFGVG
eukprot:11110455-Alexandrium_andersonii.AAC.1